MPDNTSTEGLTVVHCSSKTATETSPHFHRKAENSAAFPSCGRTEDSRFPVASRFHRPPVLITLEGSRG
jgi:hypothetical protein